MRWLCQGVTGLVCLLAASGCYRQHDADASCRAPLGHVCCTPDGEVRAGQGCPFECEPGTRLVRAAACFAGSHDAAPPRDAARRNDAGPRIDAGPEITCPEVRADFACLDSPMARAGEPFALRAAFDTCGCCPDVACAARAELETRRLFLTTGLCAELDDCDCDGCVTPTIDCPVPGLAAGTWDVVVNGGEAFELEVIDEAPPAAPACFTFADADECRPTPRLEPRPYSPDSVCLEDSRDGALRLVLRTECASCAELIGPCVTGLVDLAEREHALVLAPFLSETSCDVDCPTACAPRERRCELPRLEGGHTYHVRVNGDAEVLSFVAGPDAPRCGVRPPG